MEGLDQILHGGLPSRRLYVVEGDPGCGKTTLALQFLREGARLGQRVLYVSLSETNDELVDVAHSHGWNLDGIDILQLDKLAERMHEENAYTVFHPADVELGETLKRIRAEIEQFNPERVALDSVSELKILSQTGARYRREILGLKQFFAGRNCTVLILDDRTTRENEQQLQSIAHGVLRMEREAREYGATRRRLHVVKMRGVRFQDGVHDFVIQTGGIELFPRLSASDLPVTEHAGVVSSGNPRLDDLLGSGLDRGSSTLLMGPAGAGKTSVCTHFLHAALVRGERTVLYQFEESRETFLQRSLGYGIDFSPYLENGQFELVKVDIADLSPGEFSVRVRRAVESHGVSFVVLDSLNGYLNGMPSEKFLLIHLNELLTYLGNRGVVTLISVAQHGMLGSNMHSPVDVSFLADTVILLRFFEAQGSVRQAISVVKKRRGPHERTLREMQITDRGMFVGEVLEQFEGVLTGVPKYRGPDEQLMKSKTDA